MNAPSPPSARNPLQVVYAWQRHLLGHKLLGFDDSVTVGPSGRATFVAPQLPGNSKRFRVLSPFRGGFRLTLSPGMSGWVETRALGRKDVAAILAEPAPKKLFGSKTNRSMDLFTGDAAVIAVDPAGQLRLQLSFVEPPERIGRPSTRQQEPILFQIMGITSLVLGIFALGLNFIAKNIDVNDPPKFTEERMAEILAPVIATRKMQQVKKEGEKKKQEKEAAMSKKMKDKEGKLGRKDADKKDTVMPKGEKDILRDKVAKTGVLSILGTAAGGSGLGKLLDANSNDMDQAITGLAGAELAVGRGAGGVGNKGTGLGGGGTGFGRIQGSGNLDLGPGRGTGRRGVGLGTGKEKEVSVGVDAGSTDSDGGLTKDQIMRVVRSHMAALKYCYEKELQRKPNLAGKLELRWMIKPDGRVDRVGTASNTMGDKDVDSCMQRQIKGWVFPKASAPTLVQKFPFFFKGGA